MGSGGWDASTFHATKRLKASKGIDDFAYSNTMRSTPTHLRKAHDLLDPLKKAGDASPFAGKVMRESRDSDEHPTSTPIVCLFDVTGSMGSIPRVLQQKLPDLFGLLLRKGYVEHPQILMGGIGDSYSDSVPLQIGQFESDNRIDATLDAIFLEGGGGGGNHESYVDAAYYIAHHTATDAWDKRGRKGYCFFIGDERLYTKVLKADIKRYTDDDVEGDLDTADVFAALKERWEVFYLFCARASYRPEDVLDARASAGSGLAWRPILGQNALVLEDHDAVCETIALQIGLMEGTIDLDEGMAHLDEIGASASTKEAVGKALVHAGGGGSVVVADTPGDLDVPGDTGVERL